ncbi:shikimate dehydrogenase [Thalassotalea litorea]|uniref:Shikimate dehydrogenase (NADP(+)) n=1 Tax=Thalassotalea litorea TaxID=2020715 RepID=A0A5R9IMV0_9GAMM|nr:shikimate dehydrogenase [Thalassotalea litorea]TLU65397.1 shikimate dehydrogenase [Thalassotalea litorea]
MSPRQFCVFGNPIKQSRSPWIHQQFANQLGVEIEYEATLAPCDGFERNLKSFIADGGSGANVTAPFKEEAWRLCDQLSDIAKDSGAVNTIYISGDHLYGDNTDGFGLVADLHRQGATLTNANILLLGAGGAARGVIPALLKENPATLTIANRTASKANHLKAHFGDSQIQSCGFDELNDANFDLIINATSAGLSQQRPNVPSTIINQHTICYDMVYQATPTGFMQWCSQHGAALCIDGLGMLVGQAAKSFSIWFGKMPQIEPVIVELREMLSKGS